MEVGSGNAEYILRIAPYCKANRVRNFFRCTMEFTSVYPNFIRYGALLLQDVRSVPISYPYQKASFAKIFQQPRQNVFFTQISLKVASVDDGCPLKQRKLWELI